MGRACVETANICSDQVDLITDEPSQTLRWLFVTSDFPWPLCHGTWLRVYHLARSIRRIGDEVAILSRAGDASGVSRYQKAGVKILPAVDSEFHKRGWARSFLGPYVYDSEFAKRLSAVSGEYDHVVLFRPNMLQYSKEASYGGFMVMDMVDDPLLEEGRRLWGEMNPIRMGCRLKFLAGEYLDEYRYLKWVDLSIFVSEEDRVSFRSRNRRCEAVWVPNGVEIEFFSKGTGRPKANDRPVVSFVGNMIHSPNEEAAVYLLEEIAPLIRSQIPNVCFRIIGSHPSKRLRKLASEGVEVTGWVEDIRPLVGETTVMLMPMLTGTGIKNKLLEAWASGVAVVATKYAIQGVPAVDGDNLLIGSTREELAAKTIQLLLNTSLRHKISEGGLRTVKASLDWLQVARSYRQIITEKRAAKQEMKGVC